MIVAGDGCRWAAFASVSTFGGSVSASVVDAEFYHALKRNRKLVFTMQNHKDLVLCSTLFLFPPNHPKEKYRYFSLSVDKRKQMTRLFRISGIPRYFHGMNFFSVNIFPIGSGKRRGSPILLPDSILLLHSLGPFPVRLCDVDSSSP